MTNNTSLDERIDSLAADIERQIQSNQETLDNLNSFNPAYRRMEEAEVSEVFTDA